MKTSMVLVVFIGLVGCATQKELIPTGGSRSDGVVELSYEYGMFEKPEVDMDQGWAAATEACSAWGYSEARAFGGQTQECQAYNGYGNCVRALVTMKYQCID